MNPYAGAHASPKGEGDARPTALQIIQDEGLVNQMKDKVMIVTGASSGIGVDTAAALHATGAQVFMQVRDMEKGEVALKQIRASSEGTGKLELLMIDLVSFESIRKGVAEFLNKSNKLNVLVNNAGRFLPSVNMLCTDNDQVFATLLKEVPRTDSRHNSARITWGIFFCSNCSSLPFLPQARRRSTPA